MVCGASGLNQVQRNIFSIVREDVSGVSIRLAS